MSGSTTTAIAARLARLVVLSGIVALIAVASGWFFSGTLSTGRALVVVIVIAPLLFAFPKLLSGNRRTYAWATLAVIPYFVFAITEAVATPQQRLWSALCLSVSLLLFVALIAYLRVTRPD